MNLSNLAHGGLALAAQIITALIALAFGADLFTGTLLGALLAIGFYWGREVAQAERKAGGTPWWIGFDVRMWSDDALLDLAVPVAFCCAASAFALILERVL